jgi:hypothetical protein
MSQDRVQIDDGTGRPSAMVADGQPGETEQTSTERVKIRGPLSPKIIRIAQGLLDLPMGTEFVATVDGRRCVFVLELHYHPPGFVGAPTGWHKGVTVYELVDTALKATTPSAAVGSR